MTTASEQSCNSNDSGVGKCTNAHTYTLDGTQQSFICLQDVSRPWSIGGREDATFSVKFPHPIYPFSLPSTRLLMISLAFECVTHTLLPAQKTLALSFYHPFEINPRNNCGHNAPNSKQTGEGETLRRLPGAARVVHFILDIYAQIGSSRSPDGELWQAGGVWRCPVILTVRVKLPSMCAGTDAHQPPARSLGAG